MNAAENRFSFPGQDLQQPGGHAFQFPAQEQMMQEQIMAHQQQQWDAASQLYQAPQSTSGQIIFAAASQGTHQSNRSKAGEDRKNIPVGRSDGMSLSSGPHRAGPAQ